jgi:hypothetical protein
LIEKNWECGKKLLMVFMDYKKGFDGVKREEIWRSFEKVGIAAVLLRKVEST